MVRKNISIGVDTWNDLAALGKFGQTFDDVIQILLKEHEELKALKSRFGELAMTPEELASKKRESMTKNRAQSAEYYSHIFDADTVKPLGKGNVETTIWMPGLEFPVDQSSLIRFAESLPGQSHQLEFMKRLPADRQYNRVQDLQDDILKIINTDERMVSRAKQNGWKIVACRIRTERSESEAGLKKPRHASTIRK